MIGANIFDFIDGKVAHITGKQSEFGAFWDSTLDRFSDLALFTGLIWLYSSLGREGYVLVATSALIFSIMTSYARARAESLIEKCKVGFMERPERIVLFMIGAFTDRMAGGAVGDPGAGRGHGGQPDLLHLPGAEPPADAVDQRAAGRPVALLLLARRTGHAALRHLGDRHPGVRVADAARLAARPHGLGVSVCSAYLLR